MNISKTVKNFEKITGLKVTEHTISLKNVIDIYYILHSRIYHGVLDQINDLENSFQVGSDILIS